MITICTNCGVRNRLPPNSDPATFLCGNCGSRTLRPIQHYVPPTSGTFVTSAAVGAGIGGLIAGPAGLIIGAATGAIIAGATGIQGSNDGGDKK